MSRQVVTPIVARDATSGDNDALVALSVACPMEGDIGLAVDRGPDFFALNRLEGESWRVGVVDGAGGEPVGCVAVAERLVFRNGEASPAMYVSDLKVHPAHRGSGVADALIVWARDACIAAQGPDALVFLTILAGNQAMIRRTTGPRGLPHLDRVATFRTFSVPLLWRRKAPDSGVCVAAAQPEDLEEMAGLWSKVAATRQFSPVHEGDGLRSWIDTAPDLDLTHYRLARGPDGRLVGFLAAWDQAGFKRLRVTSYSRRLSAVRSVFNALGPIVGANRLPAPGGALHNLTAVHLCVPPTEPAVLRSLVLNAYNAHAGRGHGYSFLNVGLDRADPLAAAMKGLFAQNLDIWVCVAKLAERDETRGALDGRPFHHEIALV